MKKGRQAEMGKETQFTDGIDTLIICNFGCHSLVHQTF